MSTVAGRATFRPAGPPGPRRPLAVLALTALLAGACGGSKAAETPARDMDSIEIRAAGKNALESAREALEKRDLNTLRMVLTYVMHRTKKTPLLPSSDVALIELGIHCLEVGEAAQKEARPKLDAATPGKLERAARKACLGE